jgi:hypothetical protein
MSVFIERFLLAILAALAVLIAVPNPMGFSDTARIIDLIIIFALAGIAAYFAERVQHKWLQRVHSKYDEYTQKSSSPLPVSVTIKRDMTIGRARSIIYAFRVMSLFPLWCILIAQSLLGKYGEEWDIPWDWFIPSVLPTLALLTSAWITGEDVRNDATVRSAVLFKVSVLL